MEGHLEVVKVLIASGGLVNEATDDGKTPLHTASRFGHLEIVEVLIAGGGDVNKANDEGDTPLYNACHKGRLEMVEVLIAGGGDVNKAGKYGVTPLYSASLLGHLEIVEVLIAGGGDVNKASNDGHTPLWIASMKGHLEVVKVLIDNKANFCKDKDGKTPLDVAKTTEIKEMIMNHPWYRRGPFILFPYVSTPSFKPEHYTFEEDQIILQAKMENRNNYTDKAMKRLDDFGTKRSKSSIQSRYSKHLSKRKPNSIGDIISTKISDSENFL